MLAGVGVALVRELEATSDEFGVMRGLSALFQIYTEGLFEIFWVDSLEEKNYPVDPEGSV